ncbi:molecular chaperone DnaK [Candidatus Uhrbacteria bacterium RIFCSPLOWO2_01_FULL_47_24]|uniref:Chaperone protein DnaK n=1 Tax=Candidatus Uhrbacteria bacterium RIFCSPLOWO2_01_FULL_47_24 TaxID=1802401 RepID=A0A1F7UP50_9BACT|nr:MAG: molecular chaperone DnaK [Candidatus Uhrbacteria bacterium RIFCSPHIGHO2_01_FULL_47_11]OGL68383.1 MAG: molecular chaperone DnaK [Candidatus Uhrbacteria bacterium RIFCSPHIGHO2_02_FULL_46_47]OGL80051.1 MAG: molecular chaperone DnaK [Candidatus Uhrbacteria bacterium RIFCSPLOWO2_01_FULL_47_24]OGL84517.1 MAG: molecular chaperone DnaK [Candidatus Uhrbacteria bacterium RIFCSPLOWO2_02_FULL_46_25]OGL93487.1 MAG: molecular chaperone DnaK [Candidatus Uhrbacteria bacterium RIFCSPLOWO2_12_FULL_47_10]
MSKIIGIDLGTSNSAASVMQGDAPVIIPSAEGSTLGGKAFPSYVALTKEGELLVGEPARRQAVSNPERTIHAAKRKMGTDFVWEMDGKKYTPQQISAFILQKIKRDAEAYLGAPVEKAVITVPAYFNDAQRQATKDAGAIAGLEVVRLVNEPTAAALSYGLDKLGKEQKVLVFDLGGGTLDVTIMDMGSGGTFEVLSTSGDTQLGGTDMDNALIDHVAGEFKRTDGIDLRKDKMAMQRLKEGVEKAKIELSTTLETDVNLPFVTADANGPKHLQVKLTRAILESLIKPIVDRCRHPLEQAIADSKLNPTQIHRVIMVGGPTRMPIVQKFVEDYVGKKIERGVDPMECVAKGAAIQAAVLGGEVKDVLLLDVTPLTLGIETLGSVSTPLIERNTTIPTSKSQVFSTAADNQTTVEIHVLQGERSMATDNRTLGRFMLDGIPPSPRGVPQVEVSFDIDANGILTVTAKDKASGKSQNIVIKDSSALNKDEIEKMKKEAEAFSVQDKQKKELIDLRNQADSVIYTAEKSLRDAGDKAPADIKKLVEEKIEAIKKVKDGADAGALKKALDELQSELSKIGEAMYKSAGAQKGGAAPGADQKSDGPIEGEVQK